MSAIVHLEVTAGALKGKAFAFTEHDTFVIGRNEDCHCRLADDRLISRHHFLLEVNPPDVCIRDFGSLNGTWVNGKEIGARKEGETPAQGQRRRQQDVNLKDGDEIKAGHTILKLKIALPSKAAIVRCVRCKKDVSKEAGAGHGGEYICAECRKSIENDPVIQLVNAMAAEGQKAQAKGPPQFRGYSIKHKLGEGGFGAVYLAEAAKTKTPVAIKVMLSRIAVDLVAREKFQHEISMMKGLRHPNLVQLYDQGAVGGAFYFVMEYCEAGSLADLARRRGGKLSLDEAAPLMLQALEGLGCVHQAGLVHRDLKPENILLQGQRQNRVAKIGDLGLAKNFEQAGFSGMTVTGAYAGTLAFMPREQLTNFKYVKPVSDVWSMAAAFYVALTGALPRDFPKGRDPVEVILRGKIVPIQVRDRGIPKALADVLDRALSDNAKERYVMAGEMLAAMKAALRR